ncbi:MAG: 4a-hydroxytetrahydrobiopterin dehydratase [Myxococcota bacterium]
MPAACPPDPRTSLPQRARSDYLIGALVDGHLVRRWSVSGFAAAFALSHRIAAIADREDHHPVVRFGPDWLEVELWTWSTGGLTHQDLALAGAIDRVDAVPAPSAEDPAP